MEKEDLFEEIVDVGKRRGKLTFTEINDVVPPDYFSPTGQLWGNPSTVGTSTKLPGTDGGWNGCVPP